MCCTKKKKENNNNNKKDNTDKLPQVRDKISLTEEKKPSSNSPTNSITMLPTTSPAASPNAPNLLDQGALKEQYMREVEEMRQAYESNYQKYRANAFQGDRSLSQISNSRFTDIIKLPKGKWRTAKDVLTAKHYTLEKKVGSGGYGVVYKARFSHNGVSNVVACKVITCKKLNRLLRDLKAEVFILEKYPHPNLITLFDHFVINNKAYIIMEFANAGSLTNVLEKYGPMPEPLAYEHFVQILKGIFYLHTFHIAHRDLKTDNVLIVKLKHNHLEKVVKITDFGMSIQAYRPKEGYIPSGTYGGTKTYMSPEIFAHKLYRDLDKKGFDPFKADIWALGVLLYECLSNQLPFDRIAGDCEAIYEAQMHRRWSFPSDVILSTDVKRLIEVMLEPDPQRRIDPYGIWMHRWIQHSYVTNRGWKSRHARDHFKQKRSFVQTIIKMFK